MSHDLPYGHSSYFSIGRWCVTPKNTVRRSPDVGIVYLTTCPRWAPTLALRLLFIQAKPRTAQWNVRAYPDVTAQDERTGRDAWLLPAFARAKTIGLWGLFHRFRRHELSNQKRMGRIVNL